MVQLFVTTIADRHTARSAAATPAASVRLRSLRCFGSKSVSSSPLRCLLGSSYSEEKTA
jgi:hypothetical protein